MTCLIGQIIFRSREYGIWMETHAWSEFTQAAILIPFFVPKAYGEIKRVDSDAACG
jgi:hypothetical protein